MSNSLENLDLDRVNRRFLAFLGVFSLFSLAFVLVSVGFAMLVALVSPQQAMKEPTASTGTVDTSLREHR